MKLKCKDGKVRSFQPSIETVNGVVEARCLECQEQLGGNDLRIVKPRMKAHACDSKQSEATSPR